ncbi:alpha-galactosidase [Phenylobacterium sp.]|uniref:alpha-galactosidase n=1 Tax=Phenylobacterium sp. TaxID=1871053 RepID=UPI003BABECB1
MSQGFRLDGGGETLVFLTTEAGAPRLVYWGPDLGPADPVPALARLSLRAIPHGMLDGGERLTWLPEAGQGFTGHPGLLAHRDGAELVTQMTLAASELAPGAAHLVLEDAAAAVRLSLTLALDAASGVLSSRAALTNLGTEPLTLDWLAAGAFDSPHADLLLFDGRWTREFIPVRQTLSTGLIAKENRTGRTSHHAPPFAVIGESGFGEIHGEAIGLHLAWSGDHRIFAERLRDGRIQVQAGELLHSGEVILAPGETYETPALYLARSACGLNGLSDRFHPFVRDVILGGRLRGKTRPVHYNGWEAIYFDHDLATLKTLADLAAEAGAERYVLDDGWFKGRPDDRSGLGDWSVDPAKYPDGLTPLIDHVRGLGLEFGLWVEPEMANADSDLLRAHPDWILGDPGRDQPLGRGQYVLDLTRPEVSDNLFGQLDALLSQNAIGYLKWDMNRDLTHALSGGRAAVHRQTLAVYALIDRLRAAHPGVEIESCSSGGGRADYEILRRTDRIWTSDCNDPIERQAIQRGFSIFFPPEVMGSHVGAAASHTTARTASLDLRAMTALPAHMGIEADLRAFSDAERAALAAAIAVHKTLRAELHAGRTLRLEHPDPGCLAFAQLGETLGLVSAAQVATPLTVGLLPLRLVGLEPEATYEITMVNPPERPFAVMKRRIPLVKGDVLRATGLMLAQLGLPLPVMRAGEIAVFRLERVAP